MEFDAEGTLVSDPLDVTPRDPAPSKPWVLRRSLLLYAALIAAVIVVLAAALRPGSEGRPNAPSTAASSVDAQGRTGAPHDTGEARQGLASIREPAPSSARGAPLTGVASWHATGKSGPYAAAGPALRLGDWRGSRVTVAGPSGSLRVTLNDWCACPKRLIDLSDEAFREVCGPLSAGLCSVEVSW